MLIMLAWGKSTAILCDTSKVTHLQNKCPYSAMGPCLHVTNTIFGRGPTPDVVFKCEGEVVCVLIEAGVL